MKRKGVILSLIVFFSYNLTGQEIKISLDKYNKEKEAILNTIINSVQLDSISKLYCGSTVIFAENEVLYKGIPITLKYKKRKVKIVDCSHRKGYYYCVGHFVLNIYVEEPKNATVMIELVLKNKEIINTGITLEKEEEWKITGFDFIE